MRDGFYRGSSRGARYDCGQAGAFAPGTLVPKRRGTQHPQHPSTQHLERDRRYRQAACWQLQCSSVDAPDCLQYSLQYLPYGPPFVTVQLQLGCAHLVGSATVSLLAETLRLGSSARKLSYARSAGRFSVERV